MPDEDKTFSSSLVLDLRIWCRHVHTLYKKWAFTVKLRPRLHGENLSRVEGSPAYPSYPGRANFSYISLQNLANRLHEEQKVDSTRRVTRLAGSPFCDGRVTLLAGPTFLHINTLARLAGSTPSRRDNQSMRELCCQLLARAKGSTFFSYKRSVKLTRLGGWPSCPGQLFSI